MTASAPPLPDPIAAEFIRWCQAENVPNNTIRRRRSVLRSVGNPGTATRCEIEDWWAGRRHLKDSSRANDLAVLRSFYKWCQVWEHRPDDPTIRLRPPRAETGAPKPVSQKDFAKIRIHLDTLGPRGAPLVRAILLATWAGLRREEVARLNWSDINLDTKKARVAGKGRKTRIVDFSPRLIQELMPDTGGNVVTGRDHAWSADTLGHKVNAAIRAAGVDATFHKLRHSYGSIGYQLSLDPKALADQMGHASVATTMKFYAAAADGAGAAIADAVAGAYD